MQVEPIRPTLKAPGSMLLKLTCNDLLSNFAMKLNLRHYSKEELRRLAASRASSPGPGQYSAETAFDYAKKNRAHEVKMADEPKVGRCRLTLSTLR